MILLNHYKRYLGKPLLIVGCGPSMTDEIAAEMERLRVPTIAVNKAFMFNDATFKPTYHFFNDYSTDFIHVHKEEIVELSEKGTRIVMPIQLSKTYRDEIRDPLLYLLAEGDNKYRFYLYPEDQSPVFFSRGLTVVFTALQFAAYLGANPICLIGVDFCLTEDNRIHNFDCHSLPIKSAKRMNKTILPERMKHLDIAAYELFNAGYSVLNLSKISKLECFWKPNNTIEEALKWLSPVPYSLTGHQQAERQIVTAV